MCFFRNTNVRNTFFIAWGVYGCDFGSCRCNKKSLIHISYKKNKPTLAFSMVFAVIVIVAGIFTWTSIFSLLAIIANILAVIIYSIKKAHIIRLLNFPASGCWMVYNIHYFSIAGIINETFTLISLTISELRWRKTNNKSFD